MNSFKFAFKATNALSKQANSQLLLAIQRNRLTSAAFKPLAKEKKTFVYINHTKYLSLSCNRLNEVPPSPPQQQQQQQEQQQQGKSSGWSQWFKENGWKLSLGFVVLGSLSGGAWLLNEWGREKYDENGIPIKDEFSNLPAYLQYPKRAWHNGWVYYEMWKDPNSDKLLPEPLQEPYYQPPYTLVLEMNGVLTHPEWSINNGWRYKKRPGLDYFIDQVKYPMFEVVLFAEESCMAAAPVVAALDPENKIQFKLFRESTKYKDGVHIKDLSCLNRDVKKIILIDWNSNSFKLQPRNALHRLKKYQGEDDDTDLVYLASFLKTIAASGVDDVRDVLDYYNSEVDPLETFKINQVKLKEAEAKRQKELEEWKKKQNNSPFSWARKQR